MNEIDKELGKRLLYFDGGMGTLLQGMGLSGGERPETWNLSHPDRILDVHRRYLEAGASRVILGTAAVTDPAFTAQAVAQYGEKIAVGADLKDGKVAIKGWLETSQDSWETFFDLSLIHI